MVTEENPLGLNGFSFIEFATPDREKLEKQFIMLGFKKIAKHKFQNITLHKQGNILFIINTEKVSLAERFSYEHGASVCGMGFQVENARQALETTVMNGATPFTITVNPGEIHLPAIYGIGGSAIYFTDTHTNNKYFKEKFDFFDDADDECQGVGLQTVDHLTHNLRRGQMDVWKKYYQNIFNFKEIKYFDIKGEKTGLISRAMAAPDGKIRIPLNEGTDKNSQIEEFLTEFKGEGIQHIALSTDDIFKTVTRLRENGIKFMEVPDTYYEVLDKRLPNHEESLEKLKENRILIDGETTEAPKRLLLQIFTENMLGPVFFEIIQRKGDDGFGEGNFQALFESIERDQIRRGVIRK